MDSLGLDAVADAKKDLIDETKELVKSLSELAEAEEPDFARIKPLAHSLKGATGNFGLKKLNEVAQELDEAALKGDSAAVKPLVEQLSELLPASHAALDAHLNR
ncbi:MAG: Hpt domain-containing protein [Planctomycetota bacterium]|nr:Hpt domain-containing protein [Planctomycetota bacterium]